MIHAFDEVGSTNDLALAAAKTAEHGACWIAERQTAGRGRREVGGVRRSWHSPPGRNIYMSMVLKPDIEISRAAGLTLACGVAVCETLRLQGVDVWLKWPNDVFCGMRKMGGILTEAVTSGSRLEAVVVGIGLNINTRTEEVPEELRGVMTSLQMETSRVVDRLTVVHPLRAAVLAWSERYVSEGWGGIAGAVSRLDRSVGLPVELCDGSGREGVSEGVDGVGQLRVRLGDGELVSLSTGEVRLRTGVTSGS